MRFRLTPAVLTLSALLLPHSLRAQTTTASCAEVAADDDARFGAQPVYRECAVSKPVKTRKVVEPKFENSVGLTCVSATLEFVVDEQGKANQSSARVLATNSDAFSKILIASLEKWRFDPAELDKQKVAQLVVVDHSQRAQDAQGRTAYTVSPLGSSPRPMRPMVSGKSQPCDP